MEGMSRNCDHPRINDDDRTYTASGDQYATRHNPFAYFHSLIGEGNSEVGECYDYDVPIGTGDPNSDGLAKDLKTEKDTPNYVFITPNLCNDGHNNPCVNETVSHRILKNMEAFLTRKSFLAGTSQPRSEMPGDRPGGFAAIDKFLSNGYR
jgi:hypothetical protein